MVPAPVAPVGADSDVQHLSETARLLGAYRNALVENGFLAGEAFTLVQDYHALVVCDAVEIE